MAELVWEAGCGLIVPPEDPPALAGAIRKLARMDPEERERMGASGRKYILEHYRREDLAMKLLAVFAEAVPGATPAAGEAKTATRGESS